MNGEAKAVGLSRRPGWLAEPDVISRLSLAGVGSRVL